MPGSGVIITPHASGNRNGAGARERSMVDIVGAFGWVRVTPTVDAIDDVAREFHDRGIDILAICGGDGSAHCPLTAVPRVWGSERLPRLLPLRAGTINYVADATGGRRGTPEQVLARVVRDYRRGNTHVTTERDVLRVNGEEVGVVVGCG